MIGHDGTSDFSGELLEAAKGHSDAGPSNPYGKLNVGVIEVEPIWGHESTVRLMLVGCEDQGESTVKDVLERTALRPDGDEPTMACRTTAGQPPRP